MKRAAFFDLEKTITKHAAEQEGALEFYRQKEIPLSVVIRVGLIYLKYDLGLIDNFEAMKRSGARVFEGRDAARDRRLFEEHFNRRLKYAIYPEAIRRIDEFKRQGIGVYIVSSTYLFIVDVYARHLGVENYYGTQLEVVEGKCTGRIIDRMYHQEKKGELVVELARRDGIDLAQSYAFGDSINDQAMLEQVGHPVAVNPDRKLRAIASRKNWPIADWSVAR